MSEQQTTRSIIVKGSPSELYHLWADLEEDLRSFKAYAEARQPAPVSRR